MSLCHFVCTKLCFYCIYMYTCTLFITASQTQKSGVYNCIQLLIYVHMILYRCMYTWLYTDVCTGMMYRIMCTYIWCLQMYRSSDICTHDSIQMYVHMIVCMIDTCVDTRYMYTWLLTYLCGVVLVSIIWCMYTWFYIEICTVVMYRMMGTYIWYTYTWFYKDIGTVIIYRIMCTYIRYMYTGFYIEVHGDDV